VVSLLWQGWWRERIWNSRTFWSKIVLVKGNLFVACHAFNSILLKFFAWWVKVKEKHSNVFSLHQRLWFSHDTLSSPPVIRTRVQVYQEFSVLKVPRLRDATVSFLHSQSDFLKFVLNQKLLQTSHLRMPCLVSQSCCFVNPHNLLQDFRLNCNKRLSIDKSAGKRILTHLLLYCISETLHLWFAELGRRLPVITNSQPK
jgi:hypothetical protein